MRNPTSRQCVVRSSPLYKRKPTHQYGDPHHGNVWLVLVLSYAHELTINTGIPHHGSVWFVQVLSTERDIFRGIGNPTSRQCVDGSSPFYPTSSSLIRRRSRNSLRVVERT